MGSIIADRQARLLAKLADEAATLDELTQRMTGGTGECEGLPAICRAWDVPYGKVMLWLMANEGRYARYNRALEVQAKALVAETVSLADGQPVAVVGPDGKPLYDEDGELITVERDVARDKLRVDTRFRLAKYHDSAVYGDKATVSAGTAAVDAGLVGLASDLLRLVAKGASGPREVTGETLDNDGAVL